VHLETEILSETTHWNALAFFVAGIYMTRSHDEEDRRKNGLLTCASGSRLSLHRWGKNRDNLVEPHREEEENEEDDDDDDEGELEKPLKNSSVLFLQLKFSGIESHCKRCEFSDTRDT
jgi:hypothetical protein